MTTNIQKSAVLVNLTIGKWAGEVTDKVVTQEVSSNKNADIKAGRYVKSLFAGNTMLKEIKQVAGKARNVNVSQTLPYRTGCTLLPIGNFQQHGEAMKEFKDIYDGLVADFIASYEKFRDRQQHVLGDMFHADEYPSVEAVREKFYFHISYEPLPDNNVFDSMLGSAEMEQKLIADAETQMQSRISDATHALWQRLEKVVKHMAVTLPAYEPKVGKGREKNGFHGTLVQNVRDLCEVLPRLNLTGDADLNNYCQQVKERLTQWDAEDLKSDAVLRKNVADEASAILGQMAGYGMAAE